MLMSLITETSFQSNKTRVFPCLLDWYVEWLFDNGTWERGELLIVGKMFYLTSFSIPLVHANDRGPEGLPVGYGSGSNDITRVHSKIAGIELCRLLLNRPKATRKRFNIEEISSSSISMRRGQPVERRSASGCRERGEMSWRPQGINWSRGGCERIRAWVGARPRRYITNRALSRGPLNCEYPLSRRKWKKGTEYKCLSTVRFSFQTVTKTENVF